MQRKISIVTPSFNQASFIEENILSVLNQNYSSFEHIIIDGGSTDGTLDILKKYSHLRWVSEPDKGQSHALNKGFHMATGEIIGWLNSDDTYCTNIFDSVEEVFQDKNVSVVCGDGYEINEQGKTVRTLSSRKSRPEDLIKYWKWRYEFVQPAFFFRRSVLDEVGYLDESLYYTMDYDLLIRLGKRCEFYYLQKPLANYRLYSGSKTGRSFFKFIPNYIWEMHKVSRRYWGKKNSLQYYTHLFSFLGAICLSALKNLLFLPGSKSRTRITKFFNHS